MDSASRSHVDDDAKLVQLVDAALADATQRAGGWLACKPGCHQCCIGVFAVSQLDAERLRIGLAQLLIEDPARGERVRSRVNESLLRLQSEYPGDAVSGELAEDGASRERFEEWGNDEVCPVLDPKSGMCDLYAARPMTCRTFGPPVRTSEGGVGVCELCFIGASPETVLDAEMNTDFLTLEEDLNRDLEDRTKRVGETIVAFALR